MNEPSHSDEELLALLQPYSHPEEFDLESNGLMRDPSEDDDDNDDQPLPGPAPPAPMAPMMVAPAAPIAPMDMADSTDEKGPESSFSNPPNGVKNDSGSSRLELPNNEHQEDEDEIAYEPVKTPTRTPRSAKSRISATKSSSRRTLASSKSRSKPQKMTDLELVENGSMSESRPQTGRKAEPTPEPEPEPKQEVEPPRPPSLEFHIVINSISPEAMQEYKLIPPGDYIYRVLESIPTGVPGETWLSVEFEDGHIDQLSSYPNGRQALAEYSRPRDMDYPEYEELVGFSGQAIKRKAAYDPDSDYLRGESDEGDLVHDAHEEEEGDDDDIQKPSKRRRTNRLKTSIVTGSRRSGRNHPDQRPVYKQLGPFDEEDDVDEDSDFGGRGRRKTLRKRTTAQRGDDDIDELGAGADEFSIVKSDVLPDKKFRRGNRSAAARRRFAKSIFLEDEDDIEFEAPRRSGRTNKSKTVYLDDPNLDEEMYAPEEEKLPSAPKVSGAKEIFPRLEDQRFKDVHSTTCGTCGNNAHTPNKGMMIYCQGCSMGYHKVCLGFRTTRDHTVTKVGPSQFVLQCRDCVGAKKKKDNRTPSLDICQSCKVQGRSCQAFAPKLSATAEAKLREENGGDDPVTRVEQGLINNPDNILFRCTSCHCAYHFEHLPALGGKNAEGSVRDDRIESYSIEWKCKNCLDLQYKISTLVAWRPLDRKNHLGKSYFQVPEDVKEYLVKWDSRSYAHCEWKPGPWVFGVTNAVMRNAFPKRNDGANLYPKFTMEEAIPEEYLLPDIILNVKFKGNLHFESKEKDLKKEEKIDQALIKFQGLDYADAVWDEPPPKEPKSRRSAFHTAYSEFLNGKHFQTQPVSTIKERLRKFREQDFEKEIEFDAGSKDRQGEKPKGLTGVLMKYQIQGLNWLLHNFYQQRSVVLADEMGLGKTIQVISLIAALALRDPGCWPFLVVVPNSTCPNWRREIKQWAPDLRVVTYHGGKEPQGLAYKYELFPNGSRDMKAHVVVMSYDSAQDPDTRNLFKSVQWVGMVVDEGQRLKNDENLLYGALSSMRIPWRLLLTGTPLQNNKRELFNLLHFIDPSKNAAQLDEKYEEITSENISELHELIRPYFLRRVKAGPTGVLKFLPPMSQVILPVTMSVVQEKLCKSIMAKNPELIRAIFANTKLKSNERGSLNNILMQLRKCLGHPFLYSGAVEERDVSEETMHRNLVSASSKLVLLEQMLPKLKEKGHRVLLFSQFLGMLDIIEDFLTGIGFKYQRLDGSMSSLEKQKRIDAFNEPNSEYFAFLLSTRAGGVGINLATADTVIILDPDFNPHQDIQALSRAHRIGQKNKVLCFQLMTKSSVEEKIMQIGRKKMALDHALIETMDRKKEDDAGEDLESILKHGAEALFNDSNDKEVIKYDAEAIDKLLDRSQIKNPEYSEGEVGEKAAEKQFAFARVWETKTGGLTDDIQAEESPDLDISVWDRILKEREAEAKRLAEMNKEVLGRGSRRRQAVKYNGNGPTIPDLDDAVEVREGSDIDEDFISNDSSDDSDEGIDTGISSPRNLGKGVNAGSSLGAEGHSGLQDPSNGSDLLTTNVSQKADSSKRKKSQQRQVSSNHSDPPATQRRPRGRPRKHLEGPQPAKRRESGTKDPSKSVGDSWKPGSRPEPRAERPLGSRQPGDLVYAGPAGQRGSSDQRPYQHRPYQYQPEPVGVYSQANTFPYTGQGAFSLLGHHGQLISHGGGIGSVMGPLPGTLQDQFGNGLSGLPPQQLQALWAQAQMRVPSGSPVPPSRPEPATAAISSNGPAATPHRTSNALLTSLGPCITCQLIHLASRRCPSLASESQIRIALDDVKVLSGGDPGAIQYNKVLLQSILKNKLASKLRPDWTQSTQPQPPAGTSQPAQQQVSRQPVHKLAQQGAQQPAQQHMQHISQELVQQSVQQQAQPPAPAESSESESGSESASDTTRESRSGSSGSESGEDVLRQILNR
ncbi:hypothetical protein N0V93_000483 [Gnomoniopsis smithogilvyi]|uniref:Chromatin remodeling factor mit1 n=1 Tax=Gnomoniopsis smithogilvyi TaxID=1191159 RepID=A0A9W8Z094_9PEZI|nr:hypothetical protein N0V93_000483 [Gnomoniopsis smithogilvyi]